MSSIRAGAGLSTDVDVGRAAADAAGEAVEALGGAQPDLVVAFVSDDHRDAAEFVAAHLGERFPAAATIGCTSRGVIGGHRELEGGPAVSIFAATLPDTDVKAFALEGMEVPDGGFAYVGWPDGLAHGASLMMLVDRFSFPAGHFLEMINEERPGTPVVGGIASGGNREGESKLILNGRVLDHGAVCVAIDGRARLQAVVSQGCRPIGTPVTITRADRMMIFELAGSRPVDHIGEIWKKSSSRDRGLMATRPLQIGIAIDEYKVDLGPGDFLVRPVMGANAEDGAIAVGDVVEVGRTVQFHVADPEAADEELRFMMEQAGGQAAGALLFTCTGRGSNMFEQPDHDASIVNKGLGVPVAGLFAAGELGPIGGKNFLHGMTASIALLVDSRA